MALKKMAGLSRLFVASTVVMLGISGVAVPQAAAVSTSVTNSPHQEVMPDTAVGTLPDGTPIAGLPRYKTYTVAGETFDMELGQAMADGQGNRYWGYYVKSHNGDNSDECRIDMHTRSVNDQSLFDYSRNGFLYQLGSRSNSLGITAENQHWSDPNHNSSYWRYPVSFAESMDNFTMTVTMPRELDAPRLSGATLFTPGVGGQRTRALLDGTGSFDVSEFLTVQPYDPVANAAQEKAGAYPNERTYHNPDNWVNPTLEDTDDPYVKKVTIAHAPAGSRFVVQWQQTAPTGFDLSTTPTIDDLHIQAGKESCYGTAEVRQGESVNLPAPNKTNGLTTATFALTGIAPAWVKLNDDDSLTATPGYDVEAKDEYYDVPVQITYQDGTVITVVARVKVLPAGHKPGYEPGQGRPGATVTLPQTGDENLPQGTKFTMSDPNMTVDANTGEVTAKIPESAQAGDTLEEKVTVTYPDGVSQQVPVVVTVIDDAPAQNPKCVPTALALGIPLLFLIPVGLASQLNIPGLSPLTDSISRAIDGFNKQVEDANASLQRQLALNNDSASGAASQINNLLKQYGPMAGQIAGTLLLAAAGTAAIGLLVNNCTPGGGSSVDSVESQGSSTLFDWNYDSKDGASSVEPKNSSAHT